MKNTEWIDVNTRKPESQKGLNISGRVLCACENDPVEGNYFQRTLYYNHGDKKWYQNFSTPVAWNVKFWMPLPPNPIDLLKP